LESITSLMATNWSRVTNATATVDTNFSLTISNADTQQFFRLHKQ
jgi:hypothetical protein